MANWSPETGRTQIYNVITAVLLGLTAVACITVLVSAATTLAQNQGVVEPTPFVFPSATPGVDDPTPNATWTAGPLPTGTATVTPSITPSVSPVPSETPTPEPTSTRRPTVTPTPTITPTPTRTPLASATPTRTPFEYALRGGAVTFTSNYANNAGCNWAGIAGLVFDRNGQHKVGVVVHLTGGGLDVITTSGSKTAYGTSGWEIYLDNKPIVGTFFIQLETGTGQPLSEKITVSTVASCNSNLALLFFDQQR
jgi:hypothetical protein